MGILSAKQAMEQTAKKYGVTYEDVYREIEAVISEAMESEEPDVRALWAEIPSQGCCPTPIELVEFLRDLCVS